MLERYHNHKLEVVILENLLLIVKKKLREAEKKINKQGWMDWFWELIGY